MFSSQIFYRALFAGHWNFWSNDLGFGTPMPIGQRLDFHPVFALANLVSVWTALCAVWIVHLVAMVVYLLRLAVATEIRPPLRSVLLGCYVFSTPTVFYFYETDWVSHIVGWSLLPVAGLLPAAGGARPGRRTLADVRRAPGTARGFVVSQLPPRVFGDARVRWPSTRSCWHPFGSVSTGFCWRQACSPPLRPRSGCRS